MEHPIYVCLPGFYPSSGGAGYKTGRILQDKYNLCTFDDKDNVIWPSDYDTNLGVFIRALRPATQQEIEAYFNGVKNIKDITLNYEIF